MYKRQTDSWRGVASIAHTRIATSHSWSCFLKKRGRVEIESPVEICRVEMENTVEIESPDMFKETWADQFGVNDPLTIVDAAAPASLRREPAAGAATTREPTTTQMHHSMTFAFNSNDLRQTSWPFWENCDNHSR